MIGRDDLLVVRGRAAGPAHMPTIPRSWGARPPRASLDAPRVQPFWSTGWPSPAGLFRAFSVFREGAENCARGGRAPHFNFGFRFKTSPQPSTICNPQPLLNRFQCPIFKCICTKKMMTKPESKVKLT